jgi:hypothetical protein
MTRAEIEVRSRLWQAGFRSRSFRAEVWALLQPFASINRAGKVFPLKTGAELPRADMASALQDTFELAAPPTLITYSVSRPFPRPDWMTIEAYCRINSMKYEPGNNAPRKPDDADFLWVCLEASLQRRLRLLHFGRPEWMETEAGVISTHSWMNLTEGPDRVRMLLMNNLTAAILYLMLAGQRSEALKRLMRLQASGWLVLGQKKREDGDAPDAPETWIVLCA